MRKILFLIGAVNSVIIFLIFFAMFWFNVGLNYPMPPDFDETTFTFLYIIILVIICIYNGFSCFKEKKDAFRVLLWHLLGPVMLLLSLAFAGPTFVSFDTFSIVFNSFYAFNILTYTLAIIV